MFKRKRIKKIHNTKLNVTKATVTILISDEITRVLLVRGAQVLKEMRHAFEPCSASDIGQNDNKAMVYQTLYMVYL